jgi:hypothetical protein
LPQDVVDKRDFFMQRRAKRADRRRRKAFINAQL